MSIQQLADVLNDSPFKLVIACTGGGISFGGRYPLLDSSKTIVAFHVPYAPSAFDSYTGVKVKQYASEEAALALARKAFVECLDESDLGHAVGIGVACSLVRVNEREGRVHRIYIALHTHDATTVLETQFRQGLSRSIEETYVCDELFNMLARAVLGTSYVREYITDEIRAHTIERHVKRASRSKYGQLIPRSRYLALLPGSFNPLHEGHVQMKDLAEKVLGMGVYYEMSLSNIDKGGVDYLEVKRRVDFMGTKPVLTFAPTFKQKVELFSSRCENLFFVVGADTWNRLLNPHCSTYAGSSEELAVLFKKHNVKFLVFPRDGSLIAFDPLLEEFLITHPEVEAFSNPISSTSVRHLALKGLPQ